MWLWPWRINKLEEKHRGYDLPYAADPSYQIAFMGIGLVALAASLWFYWSEGAPVILTLTVLFSGVLLTYAAQLLARLHIVPEGIAITLFGITLRRVPAEQIRTIVALRKYENKANPQDVMAICSNTVEELTVLGNRNMPKLLQREADRWYGQTAASYLYRRANTFRGEMNLYKHILWLDWSVECLGILREMYPNALWLDGTEKKIYDAQLKQ